MEPALDSRSSRKRPRADDQGGEGPELSESKRARLDSTNSGADSPDLVLNRAESDSPADDSDGRVDSDDSGVNSPEAKRIQDDLLSILDDSDEHPIQDLDSVMRSFEEEILVAEPVPAGGEVTSFSGGSQPDLGYLLEASDDELGLPPAVSGEEEKVGVAEALASAGSEVVSGYGDMLGFEEQIPSYEAYEFGLGGDSGVIGYNGSYNDNGDFVVGGLFDFSDENFVPADGSGMQFRAESLSAS
ncbi:hypothetical protein Tsubulata_045836 [Turnera subulata]|uniref:Uncharacterized protein n=1 Tax=Turnera subulata TaxID=218843 RepID=A0A9Q0FHX2_9ROSI|nr:hypothetical protein Tsubulata_045836 [Turnera subulata]